jgi:hypothetical protein
LVFAYPPVVLGTLIITIKAALVMILVCSIAISFGQSIESKNVEMNVTVGYRPATIELIKKGKRISVMELRAGTKLTYKSLKTGYYEIVLSGKEQPTRIYDSILVKKGKLLVLKIDLQGPCLYGYPRGYVPVCPRNHTNNITPIVYGLVGFINKSDSIKDKVRLGGCVVTGCDPGFYCTIHRIEF